MIHRPMYGGSHGVGVRRGADHAGVVECTGEVQERGRGATAVLDSSYRASWLVLHARLALSTCPARASVCAQRNLVSTLYAAHALFPVDDVVRVRNITFSKSFRRPPFSQARI